MQRCLKCDKITDYAINGTLQVLCFACHPNGKGYKDDSGKERFDLIPFGPLFELAKVYTMGATKYDDWNWAKGLAYSRVFAAMMRHAWKFWRGEEFDPDGQHHLDSVAWCAFALREYQLHAGRYKEFDDRRIAHETRL